MPKKARSLRLGERTWSQLDDLATWLRVSDKTKAVEVLTEEAYQKMNLNSQQQIHDWLVENYPIGKKVQFGHPNGEGEKEAVVISRLTDAHLANGVRLRFADGTFVDVPIGRLWG